MPIVLYALRVPCDSVDKVLIGFGCLVEEGEIWRRTDAPLPQTRASKMREIKGPASSYLTCQ